MPSFFATSSVRERIEISTRKVLRQELQETALLYLGRILLLLQCALVEWDKLFRSVKALYLTNRHVTTPLYITYLTELVKHCHDEDSKDITFICFMRNVAKLSPLYISVMATNVYGRFHCVEEILELLRTLARTADRAAICFLESGMKERLTETEVHRLLGHSKHYHTLIEIMNILSGNSKDGEFQEVEINSGEDSLYHTAWDISVDNHEVFHSAPNSPAQLKNPHRNLWTGEDLLTLICFWNIAAIFEENPIIPFPRNLRSSALTMGKRLDNVWRSLSNGITNGTDYVTIRSKRKTTIIPMAEIKETPCIHRQTPVMETLDSLAKSVFNSFNCYWCLTRSEFNVVVRKFLGFLQDACSIFSFFHDQILIIMISLQGWPVEVISPDFHCLILNKIAGANSLSLRNNGDGHVKLNGIILNKGDSKTVHCIPSIINKLSIETSGSKEDILFFVNDKAGTGNGEALCMDVREVAARPDVGELGRKIPIRTLYHVDIHHPDSRTLDREENCTIF